MLSFLLGSVRFWSRTDDFACLWQACQALMRILHTLNGGAQPPLTRAELITPADLHCGETPRTGPRRYVGWLICVTHTTVAAQSILVSTSNPLARTIFPFFRDAYDNGEAVVISPTRFLFERPPWISRGL